MDQELIDRYTRTSELTRRGMAKQAALGKPQGPVPLGYRNVRRGGVKTVELADPETVRLVQEAFKLAAKGMPLREVLAEITKRGLRSRHDKPLGPSALWGILTNPFYRGSVRFNTHRVKGQHQALVDEETFIRVQEWLAGNRRRRRH